MSVFTVWNGPMPTTAAQLALATGTAVKTHIQLATPATAQLEVVEWGVSFDAAADAAKVKVELVETAAINATMTTAYVAADIIKSSDPNGAASLMTLGTAASGWNASAEGTIVATRVLDAQWVSPAGGYLKQFPLGREPVVAVSKFLRVRITSGVTYNALCYVSWFE